MKLDADCVVCAAVPEWPAESSGQWSPARGGARAALQQHPRHCTSALHAVGSSHVSGAGESTKHKELDRPCGPGAGVQNGELHMSKSADFTCSSSVFLLCKFHLSIVT